MALKDNINKTKQQVSDSLEHTKQNVSQSYEKGLNSTKRFIRKVFMYGGTVAIIMIVGYFIWANYVFSDGKRAGDLIKISRKGMIFKTYEGQLKLGGIDLTNPDESLSDTWSFSVRDKDVYHQLESLQGKKVILHYCEIKQSMPWQGDSNYFVTSVEQQE